MPRQATRGGDDEARGGRFAGKSLVDARVRELLGICRGILADRQLHDREIVTLDEWLAAHGRRLPEWPWTALAKHLKATLVDGLIEDDERDDLLAFLDRVTGEDSGRSDAPSSLPYSDPVPFIDYAGSAFCLTGTFIYGSRAAVCKAIQQEGGTVVETPQACDFLVIGATITQAWKYGTWGRKIEKAVESRHSSGRPAIVREEDWVVTLC